MEAELVKKRERKVTNSDCHLAYCNSAGGGRSGVTTSEPAYVALVGRAQGANSCLSLSVSAYINTWRGRFLLDTLCCLWDSWRVAGKNLNSYILYSMCQYLTAWLLDTTLSS